MTNVVHTFMDRRQSALARSAAAAWAEICGDYDPSKKGDGNYDAMLRRETSAATIGSTMIADVVQFDPAQDLPHIRYQTYWDVEELPEAATVIFPKGVWDVEA